MQQFRTDCGLDMPATCRFDISNLPERCCNYVYCSNHYLWYLVSKCLDDRFLHGEVLVCRRSIISCMSRGILSCALPQQCQPARVHRRLYTPPLLSGQCQDVALGPWMQAWNKRDQQSCTTSHMSLYTKQQHAAQQLGNVEKAILQAAHALQHDFRLPSRGRSEVLLSTCQVQQHWYLLSLSPTQSLQRHIRG